MKQAAKVTPPDDRAHIRALVCQVSHLIILTIQVRFRCSQATSDSSVPVLRRPHERRHATLQRHCSMTVHVPSALKVRLRCSVTCCVSHAVSHTTLCVSRCVSHITICFMVCLALSLTCSIILPRIQCVYSGCHIRSLLH